MFPCRELPVQTHIQKHRHIRTDTIIRIVTLTLILILILI
jgi:hypothetical protein